MTEEYNSAAYFAFLPTLLHPEFHGRICGRTKPSDRLIFHGLSVLSVKMVFVELWSILYSFYICIISMREMKHERSIRRKVEYQEASGNRHRLDRNCKASGRDRDRKYSLKVKIGNIGYSKL